MSQPPARRLRYARRPCRRHPPGPTDRWRYSPLTSCSALIRRRRRSGLLYCDSLNDDRLLRMTVPGAVGVVRARLGHALDNSQSRDDLAERRVVGAQGGVLVHDEELTAVAVRQRGVRHGHGARRVGGPGGVLVGEPVARTTGALARGVPALQHGQAAGGQPVARRAAEVILRRQVHERVDRAGRLAVQQVDHDIAAVGDDGRLIGGGGGGRGRRHANTARRGRAGRVGAVRGWVGGLGGGGVGWVTGVGGGGAVAGAVAAGVAVGRAVAEDAAALLPPGRRKKYPPTPIPMTTRHATPITVQSRPRLARSARPSCWAS